MSRAPRLRAFGAALALWLGGGAAARAEEVWFWSATCGGPELTLEVRLATEIVYRSVLPICRAERSSPASQGQRARMDFAFRPARSIEWRGYRDEPDMTDANQALSFDLWQAGADAGHLTIGLSVRAKDRVVMNTVHIAKPAERSDTPIAEGLVVSTYPAQ